MSRANIGRLALLWGSSFLWIKLALRGLDPVQIVLVRLALGAAVLIPITLSRRQRLPRDPKVWGHLVVAALIANAIPYLLFGIGEKTTGSNVAGILNATTPLWTAVIGLTIGTDRTIGARRAVGLALGLAGTVLIFSPWHREHRELGRPGMPHGRVQLRHLLHLYGPLPHRSRNPTAHALRLPTVRCHRMAPNRPSGRGPERHSLEG